MGFKEQKKAYFLFFFFKLTKWIILFELLAYKRTTFQQNFMKFLSKNIENWVVESWFSETP